MEVYIIIWFEKSGTVYNLLSRKLRSVYVQISDLHTVQADMQTLIVHPTNESHIINNIITSSWPSPNATMRLLGRTTSFVMAANGRHLCILAWTSVNVVAVTTIRVLHVGVIGHHVPCH